MIRQLPLSSGPCVGGILDKLEERWLWSVSCFVFPHTGQNPSTASSILSERKPRQACPWPGHRHFVGKSSPGLMPRAREGSIEQGQTARWVPEVPHFQLLLTNPELKIVERMLVDLLYAFGQGEREVGQGTQMFPLIFTLL